MHDDVIGGVARAVIIIIRHYNIGDEMNDVCFTWIVFCVASISGLMSSTNSRRNNIYRLASKINFLSIHLCENRDKPGPELFFLYFSQFLLCIKW